MQTEEVLKLLEKASTLRIHKLKFDGLEVEFQFDYGKGEKFINKIPATGPLVDPNFEIVNKIPATFTNPEAFAAQDKVYGDIKAEDILKPPAYLDKLSEEEILYAATPYFEELQAKKQMHEEQLKAGEK